jgi:hypothetical protein
MSLRQIRRRQNNRTGYWVQAHVCPKQRLASGLTLEEWLTKKHPPAPKGCTTWDDCVKEGCHGECLPSAGEEKAG